MDLDFLLPILRSDTDSMAALAPYWPVVSGIALYLAEVKPRENGNLGVRYVLSNHLKSLPPTPELLEIAHANLKVGLRVERKETALGNLLEVSRPGAFGASAVTLPDFHDNASSWTNSADVFVCILSPDVAIVTGRDSTTIPKLRSMAAANAASSQPVNLAGITYWLGPNGASPDSSPAQADAQPAKPWWKRLGG